MDEKECTHITPVDNMLVCGSNGSGQLALFPHQMNQAKELDIIDHQTGGLFDYVPIKLDKLLISHDGGENIVDVVVGTTFTLYLSSFSRVYCCGKNLLFDETCSKIVNMDVPCFRWVYFFDPVRISELEGVDGLVFVKYITCGAKHCAFQLSNNSVYVVGNNEMGQIGMGKCNSMITYPRKLEIGSSFQLGNNFPSSQSLSSVEDVDDNSEDELDNFPSLKKRKVSAQKTSSITNIKCSYDNTVLQTADGFVYASGDNEYQQISNVKEEGKIFEFRRLFFKELPLDQYKNIKEIIVMDNFVLALTIEGRLYISEGNHSFDKMGLDIDYFNTTNFPQNSITQIFKTSYAFFVRTGMGEIFYLQQGLSKMVKSQLLSYNDFIIGSGRYHVVSISTNLHNEGLYDAIGYNKFGNLGFRSSEETVKVPQSIPKVTDWIRSKSLHSCCYKLAADFFNTIVYRVKDLNKQATHRMRTNLISHTQLHYSDIVIISRFEYNQEIGDLQILEKRPTITKKGSFDEGTSNEQLKHIMDLMTSGGNNDSKK